jgi:uncharacterized protein YeaO (DUF488 family)
VSRKTAPRTLIELKRAYDETSPGDGLRILVDRLWPRGLSKTKLKVDAWPKHLSPSTELRRWYHGDGGTFAEFRRRYLAELKAQGESLDELRALLRGRKVTLITGAREPATSHAKVLRDALMGGNGD